MMCVSLVLATLFRHSGEAQASFKTGKELFQSWGFCPALWALSLRLAFKAVPGKLVFLLWPVRVCACGVRIAILAHV